MTAKVKLYISWITKNVWYLIAYLCFCTLTVTLSLTFLNKEIECSRTEIEDCLIKDIFEKQRYFGTCDEIHPEMTFKKQKYKPGFKGIFGNRTNVYKISGDWNLHLFELVDSTVIEYRLIPQGIGLNKDYYETITFLGLSPEPLEKSMYQSCINRDDYNFNVNNNYKLSKLRSLKSKFHEISEKLYYKKSTYISHTKEPMGKGLIEEYVDKRYSIVEKESSIQAARMLYISLSIIITSSIFIAFVQYIKRRANHKAQNHISNKQIIKIDSVDELLEKLNPSNFMSPYDANKVKIANDLYSALLKSRDNDTVVEMIKEKAQKELGIR